MGLVAGGTTDGLCQPRHVRTGRPHAVHSGSARAAWYRRLGLHCRTRPSRAPSPHTRVARYVPGQAAAARADLVICNGGSATVYQALAAGTPVLGIPSNLDQYLMMEYVRRSGAGDYLRAGTTSRTSVTELCERLLDTPAFRDHAGRLQAAIDPDRTARAFEHHLKTVLGSDMSAPASGSRIRRPPMPALGTVHGDRSSSSEASRR